MTMDCLNRLVRRGALPGGVTVPVTLGLILGAMVVAAGTLALLRPPTGPGILISLIPPLALALPLVWLVVRLSCDVETLHQRTRALSMSDPDTGLHNSRFLYEIGAQQVSQARRYNHPLTAIAFRFEGVGAADKDPAWATGLLRSGAARLRIIVRECDIFCRLDDDTLVLLLPETDADGAALLVERLRAALDSGPCGPGTGAPCLTARFGIATMARPDLDHLLDKAQEALDLAIGPADDAGSPDRLTERAAERMDA